MHMTMYISANRLSHSIHSNLGSQLNTCKFNVRSLDDHLGYNIYNETGVDDYDSWRTAKFFD